MAPVKNSTSVPHTPTRSTSTTTSPGAATGTGTSRTSYAPGAVRTNARMRSTKVRSRVIGCGG